MRKDLWPELPYNEWRDTLDTLHMWMQVVGKIKLKYSPFINQWWEVAFYVTPSGITTGIIPYKSELLQVDFDFFTHTLRICTSANKMRTIPLQQQTVAAFYGKFMNALKSLDIPAAIFPVPVEVPNPIPFAEDTLHASYDKKCVATWWRALVSVNSIFERFRSAFRGKSSPIHFFWGSFDLNGTRFSGKMATPPKPSGTMGKIMEFAEDEENFSFGFWPGDQRFPQPAFFSYMYPEPAGTRGAMQFEGGISFNEELSEYILPYDIARKTGNPEKEILHFLESTYKKSATLAGWDIHSLRTHYPAQSP